MFRKLIASVLVALLMTLSAIASTSNVGNLFAYTEARNLHTLSLLKLLNKQRGDYCYSPYASSTLLTAILAGSNNQTADELYRAMHFDMELEAVLQTSKQYAKEINSFSNKELGTTIANSSSIWAQDGFPIHPYYTIKLKKYHPDLDFRLIDFYEEPNESRKEINAWIREQDRYYKNDAISSGTINSDYRMIPVNVFNFQASFKYPFERSNTDAETFTRADGQQIEVPMMHTQAYLQFHETDDFQIFNIPYSNENLYMTVILPRSPESLERIVNELDMHKLELPALNSAKLANIKLPRIKTTTMYDLNLLLEGLGVQEAFKIKQADFTNISVFKGLHIDLFIHRATFTAEEDNKNLFGFLKKQSLANSTSGNSFTANMPFIYLIREQMYDSILCVGRYSGYQSTHPQSALADLTREEILQYASTLDPIKVAQHE